MNNQLKDTIRILGVLGLYLVLLGCEQDVDINITNGPDKIVVEGAIETNLPPYVILTKSIGFLSKIDLETLQNSFIHGASIKVSDGLKTITLKEYAIDTGSSGNKYYFYSIDTADIVSRQFRGTPLHTYSLQIDYDQKTYTAHTAIPLVKPLDSIWIDKPGAATLAKIPDARLIYFRYTDPDTPGNSVRTFTQRNSESYYPAVGSVYDDEIVNGSSVNTSIGIGYGAGQAPSFDSLGFAYLHDTITIKWCAIDRPVFKFWSSYEYSINTTGSPFASPINLQTNITGGALGVWSGYGSSYKTIIVKD